MADTVGEAREPAWKDPVWGGPYALRVEALRLAAHPAVIDLEGVDESPDGVVERAEAYLAFLQGKRKGE